MGAPIARQSTSGMQNSERQEVSVMISGSQWKQKYGILKDYISSNSDIHIGWSEVHIPEAQRGRFFSLFDEVREAFVESWKGSSDFDVYSLSRSFVELEHALSQQLNLEVELPSALSSLLRNPKEGLKRLIYTRLFELVQGKIPEDEWERIADGDLNKDATALFRVGYETWTALALISLMEPDEISGVALDDGGEPLVAQAGRIAFGRQFRHPAKRIPEFVVHSKRLDRYIAFKMPLAREVDAYYVPVEIATQRLLRNRTGDTSSVLDHRMIFLSGVPDLKKLPVFADIHKREIHSPDLTIEILMEQDLSDPGMIGQVDNRAGILKPRAGGALVLAGSKSRSGPFKLTETIDAFSVGLEQAKLQPVIDKLVQ